MGSQRCGSKNYPQQVVLFQGNRSLGQSFGFLVPAAQKTDTFCRINQSPELKETFEHIRDVPHLTGERFEKEVLSK